MRARLWIAAVTVALRPWAAAAERGGLKSADAGVAAHVLQESVFAAAPLAPRGSPLGENAGGRTVPEPPRSASGSALRIERGPLGNMVVNANFCPKWQGTFGEW